MRETKTHERARARRPRLAWLPNALTWARLMALPALWVLALLEMPRELAVAATAVALTDVLDGFLARRLGVTSRRGGALDSRADHLLSISIVLWMVMLRPQFFREQWLPLSAWSAFALGVLAYGWMRRGQPVNLHLYSAKVAGVTGYVFGLMLIYYGTYSRVFFVAALSLAIWAALEALLVILTGRVDSPGGTIFVRRRA
ncbi:MAG TPA: CDP-alcohol phosphatidyltransferase family protein [Longimicrobium sp.]|nr:CDP-alcohol phosphatidyltransferase family protein [Longimicrobium sp.]